MPNWDERYSQGEHINDEPHPLVVEYTSNLTAGRALDIACGVGRHAICLADHGWQVTAVDSSQIAVEILRERASLHGVIMDVRLADLERSEFAVEPNAYDLIVVTHYLQRNLFPAIRSGVCLGGVVLAVIPMVDDDPNVKPMNSAFLLQPGELRSQFDGWEFLHDFEGKGEKKGRAMAEVVVRKRV